MNSGPGTAGEEAGRMRAPHRTQAIFASLNAWLVPGLLLATMAYAIAATTDMSIIIPAPAGAMRQVVTVDGLKDMSGAYFLDPDANINLTTPPFALPTLPSAVLAGNVGLGISPQVPPVGPLAGARTLEVAGIQLPGGSSQGAVVRLTRRDSTLATTLDANLAIDPVSANFYVGTITPDSGASGDVMFVTGDPSLGAVPGSFFPRMMVHGNTGNVGVGTGVTAPTARLEVMGAGNTSATETFRLTNANGTLLAVVNDVGNMDVNGNIEVGQTTGGRLRLVPTGGNPMNTSGPTPDPNWTPIPPAGTEAFSTMTGSMWVSTGPGGGWVQQGAGGAGVVVIEFFRAGPPGSAGNICPTQPPGGPAGMFQYVGAGPLLPVELCQAILWTACQDVDPAFPGGMCPISLAESYLSVPGAKCPVSAPPNLNCGPSLGVPCPAMPVIQEWGVQFGLVQPCVFERI